MKNIYLEITPFYPTVNSFRGPYIYDQVKALQKNGQYEIIVLKPRSIFSKINKYTFDNTTVYLFPFIKMPGNIFNGIQNKINVYLFKKYIKKSNIDIFKVNYAHAHSSLLSIIPIALKKINPQIKTILQHHALDPYGLKNGKLKTNMFNLNYKVNNNLKLFSQIDVHVSISNRVEENLRIFPQISEFETDDVYKSILFKIRNKKPTILNKSIILYNGVDSNKFYKITRYKEDNEFTIGCIGNFTKIKDQITLIKAIKLLIIDKGYTDIKLKLIGSGYEMSKCIDYVNKNNLERFIHFYEEVNHRKLLDFYNTLDLFILPSYYEGLGCVYLEANACGVPFIACKFQGIGDFIKEEEESKWLFSPRDEKQLSLLIEDYKMNPTKQVLKLQYDINHLISEFLTELKND